jgi:integrase
MRFNLRDKNSTAQTAIQMVINYENTRVKIPTGLSVPPKYWLDKKQRAKVIMEFPDASRINDKLDEIEAAMSSLLKKYRDQEYFPDPATLKLDFQQLNGVAIKSSKAKTFWNLFDEFVAHKEKEFDDVRDYQNSLRKHLLNAEKRMSKPLSIEMIGLPQSKFSEIWKDYLTYEAPNSQGDLGLAANTIGKQNKNLKSFLNWCFDLNIANRFSLKVYPTVNEEVDKIHISENELEKIASMKLDDETEDKVRDLFIIGCETGLRFSDFSRIDRDDIRDGSIHFRPKKTSGSKNNKVVIPISQRLNGVLQKHGGQPPHFDINRVSLFNKILREVCQKAGLDDDIVFYRKVAGRQIKEVRKRYSQISSHTCRRTFCTLKFLKGMPAQAIMKFSGHKTERNFLKYLKLDAEMTAIKFKEFF